MTKMLSTTEMSVGFLLKGEPWKAVLHPDGAITMEPMPGYPGPLRAPVWAQLERLVNFRKAMLDRKVA